jgi:hypothetical protein
MSLRLPHLLVLALIVVGAFLIWRNRQQILSAFRG